MNFLVYRFLSYASKVVVFRQLTGDHCHLLFIPAMYSSVSGCCTAYWEYLFALLILSQALHASISGNDLSGRVCGTGVMVLLFQLYGWRCVWLYRWLFPPCLHPGFSSKNTDPRSYIDIMCLGHLLAHLHIRGQCCILETTLVFRDAASKKLVFTVCAGTRCQRWWPREASSTYAEKNSQKLVVHLMVSNDWYTGRQK